MVERDMESAARAGKRRAERNRSTAPRKVSGVVVGKKLTKKEARALVAEWNASMRNSVRIVLELREGEGHEALGYESWDELVRVEFGITRTHAYRLLTGAKVFKQIAQIHPGVNGLGERHLRELAPLLDKPKELRELVEGVFKAHASPTVGQIREIVQSAKAAALDAGRAAEEPLASESDGKESTADQVAPEEENDEYEPIALHVVANDAKRREDEEDDPWRPVWLASGRLRSVTENAEVAAELIDTVTALVERHGSERALEDLRAQALA